MRTNELNIHIITILNSRVDCIVVGEEDAAGGIADVNGGKLLFVVLGELIGVEIANNKC
jgi:hypothetical protein